MIEGSGENIDFINFLKKFQTKVLFVIDTSVAKMVDTTILENSSRKHPPIALLCVKDALEDVIKPVKFQGNRRGVRNKADSPFRMIEIKAGTRNLLAPYFAKEWVRMYETGLSDMWNKMSSTSLFLRVKGAHLEKHKYFEAVQTFFGNPKDMVPFHEATPILVELIKPIFVICGVILILAVVGFIAEHKELVRSWYLHTYTRTFREVLNL